MPLLGDRKTDRTKAKCSCSAPVITCDCFVACHDLKMSICLFHCVANVNAIKMCSFGRQPKRRTKKVRRAKRRQKNEGKRTNWKRNAKSFKLSFCTLLLHTVVAFLFLFFVRIFCFVCVRIHFVHSLVFSKGIYFLRNNHYRKSFFPPLRFLVFISSNNCN